MNVLVIAAHPDDEVLGCGGTIAKLSATGHEVHLVILGEGITSRYVQRENADPAQIQDLHQDSILAAGVLGVKQRSQLGFPDNRFDTVPLLEIAQAIERAIEDIQPSIVFTQHGGDLNIDHVVTYRATLTATRPAVQCPVKRLYAYEVQSSTEWAFQRFAPIFAPNVFVDIGETLTLKIRAMEIYRSEVRPFPHPRSAEAIRAYAQRWGSVAGLQAAEAFELVRDIFPF